MEFTRRSALGAAGIALAGTAGCTETVLGVISGESFDTVTISIDSTGTWTGTAEFDDGTTTNTVPRFNGIQDAELVIPDDLQSGDEVDSVEPPISVSVSPRDDGTTEETPLTVTVEGDGEELGSATATSPDETATVEYDP
ncbi:hypothetical protein G9464_04270 [Halostella sp. JP-L12]|uniref:hypothetical protein n=1 Tax=Halostella TaxID=1843185 RepID=UPI000EF7651A|nr:MULTISPECIES: hypothetical protein [Halostella]NHN46812.1 hypothetical protein [Halostella sp. JP-L12]